MFRLSREAKIGVFVGFTLLILAVFILVVGDMARLFRRPGYPLVTSFESALGVEPHTVVRMAGVKIGYVKNIRLVEHRALITLSIFPEVQVPRGSKASLASLGLLGEKYIEIFPGKEPGAYNPNEELPSLPSVSFDHLGLLLVSLGDEIKELSYSLRRMVGPEERESLSVTLNNLAAVSREIKFFLESSRPGMESGVLNFSRVTSELGKEGRELSHQLQALTAKLERWLEENSRALNDTLEDFQDLSQKLGQTLRRIDNLLEHLEKGEGTAGRLLHEPELYEQAKRVVEQVSTWSDKASQLRAEPGLRADYLPAEGKIRGQLSFTLSPKGKESRTLLSFSIVRDARSSGFLYSLEGGLRIGRVLGKAGFIESEFGGGLEVEAVRQRVYLGIETFALSRGAGPNWRILSRFHLADNIYFVFGVDDLGWSKRRSLLFGFGAGH